MFNQLTTGRTVKFAVRLLVIFLFLRGTFLSAQPFIERFKAKSGSSASIYALTNVAAGSLLVVTTGVDHNMAVDCSISSSPSLTWTKAVDASGNNNAQAEIYTAVFTAGGSITITSNWGSHAQASVCYIVRNEETTLGGNSNTVVGQAAPSLSLTTSMANSLIFCTTTDFDHKDGAGRAYRDGATETNYYRDPDGSTFYHYYKQATSVTSYTEGLTTPSDQDAKTALLEIRGPSQTDAAAPSSFTLSQSSATSGSITLSWTTATDNVAIAGYDIYYAGVDQDEGYIGTTSSTSYAVTGLNAHSAYRFYVRAKDAIGHSTNSNTILALSSGDIDYLGFDEGTVTTYDSNDFGIDFPQKIIQNLSFINTDGGNQNGDGLVLTSCSDVIIRNCTFYKSANIAIALTDCNNITIENCLFYEDQAGVLATTCTGGIVIKNCQFINMRGPYPGGQFVQFKNCTGAGNKVEDNRGENWYGESYPEDQVNMDNSSGTSVSPILIQNNKFRGGGPSGSGGGIVAGDDQGDYITIQNNQVYNPGQYGINIVGGTHNQILNNDVWGDKFFWSNVGIAVFNDNGPCTDALVSGNRVDYTNSSNIPNPYYNRGDCSGSLSTPASLTKLQMNFPDQLITYITEDELWHLRVNKDYMADIISSAATQDGVAPEDIERPTADAGTGITATTSSTTLNGSGSSDGNSGGNSAIKSYHWTQISGPNTPTIVAPNSSSTSVTGMIYGLYEFRLEVTAFNGSQHADWVSVTCNTATISGTVSLQGRGSAPNALWQVPLHVNLYASGNPVPVHTYTVTTDQYGHFEITGIPTGTYHISVKHDKMLQRVKVSQSLSNGTNSLSFGTLIAGDTNNDNYVDAVDYNRILILYNTASTDPNFDPECDLNDDGYIDAIDYNLALINYNTAGETVP